MRTLLVCLFPFAAYGASTSITLATNPNPSTLGAVVTITATITPAQTPGSIAFYDGTVMIGAKVIANGSASIATITLGAGVHSLRASYFGATGFDPSASGILVHRVNPRPVSVYTAAPNPVSVTGPTGLAVADFNRDGVADVAVASPSTDAVLVLLGVGNGTFGAPRTLAGQGSRPSTVAAGDLNGDGFTDIAAAGEGNGFVNVFLGDGAGAFTAAARPQAGQSVKAIGMADFQGDGRGDGKMDLAVIARDSGQFEFRTLQGNGDGTFQPPTIGASAAAPTGFAFADFDRNGLVDLAASAGTSAFFYRHTLFSPATAGLFYYIAEIAAGSAPVGITTGDFNGDGLVDAATANSGGDVMVLTNTGRITFEFDKSSLAVGAGAASIVAGDFNGDGRTDLAVTRGAVVTFWYSQDPATFSAPRDVTVGGAVAGIATADFNGDGRPDLAVINGSTNTLSVLLGGLGPAATITSTGGSGQTGQIGRQFPALLEATVRDAAGLPLSGVTVTFSSGASVVTDANGVASTAVAAQAPAGEQQVTATAAGAGSTVFRLTSVPAANLAVVSPVENQTIAVPNITVEWAPSTTATGYLLQVTRRGTGQILFTGSLAGASSTRSVVNLPAGDFTALVQSCTGANFTVCAAYDPRNFTVQLPAPSAAPSILTPVNGVDGVTVTMDIEWTAVPGAERYEITLRNVTRGTVDLLHTVIAPSVKTSFSPRSGAYELEVRACTASCGPAGRSSFVRYRRPPTPGVPSGPPCTLSNDGGQNRITCQWQGGFSAAEAVQQGAGPGGGALSVGSTLVFNQQSFTIPNGNTTVLMRYCGSDECGPYNSGTTFNANFGNPGAPVVGTPAADVAVNGPSVLFSWSRIPNDSGTFYRLYVQDFARQQPAVDVITSQNFWAAQLLPGRRYDALVIANPGTPNARQGPARGFNTLGASPVSPTLVAPSHNSTVPEGTIRIGWTPVAGASLYQYYVARQGESAASAAGVTTGLEVQAPLGVVNSLPTGYTAIVRACASGFACSPASDTGWGPWSSAGGSGVAGFTVTPLGGAPK